MKTHRQHIAFFQAQRMLYLYTLAAIKTLCTNIHTGESGWMLSGSIAGSMTALSPENWVNMYLVATFSNPNSVLPDTDPLSAAKIRKIPSSDLQKGTVNQSLQDPLAVFVMDSLGKPVKGASVTFRIIAGEGSFNGAQAISATTDQKGLAKAALLLGKHTADNAYYLKLNDTDANYTQVGLNIVAASVSSHSGDIQLAEPFEEYGLPDAETVDKITIIKQYGGQYVALPNNPAGPVSAKVLDQYNNPLSNVPVRFTVTDAASLNQVPLPAPPPQGNFRSMVFYKASDCPNPYPLYADCESVTTTSLSVMSGAYGVDVQTITGNTYGTKYTIIASAELGLAQNPTVSFTMTTDGELLPNYSYMPPAIAIRSLPGELAGKVGTELKASLAADLMEFEDEYTLTGPQPCVRNGQNTTGYTIVPTGTVSTKMVTNGIVTFTPKEVGGSVGATQNLNNGRYEAKFIAGTTPMKNTIDAWAEALVTIPEILYDLTSDKGQPYPEIIYFDKIIKQCYDNPIRTQTIPLRTSQYGMFYKDTLQPVFGPATPYWTISYTAWGVDAKLAIALSIILLNDQGQSTVDAKITYTILPPEYAAASASIDLLKTVNNIDTWTGYLSGDKTQGAGSTSLIRGTQFDITAINKAEVVLNRGSDVEVRGDKATIPVAQIQVKKDVLPASVDEIKFGTGANAEKRYHLKLQAADVKSGCESLSGRIRVIDKNGQPIVVPGLPTDFYPTEYQLAFELSLFGFGSDCLVKIIDTTSGVAKKTNFIVSNQPQSSLASGSNAILYGGLGNQLEIEIQGIKKYMPIEPVGIIILGIDGLRQDVLYAPPGGGSGTEASYNDPQGCVNGSCYVSPSQLTGLCEVLGGKNEGIFSYSCDSIEFDKKHIKLTDVTAIFPSITFASWASIFTGKMPKDTGILGNEFFARDIYEIQCGIMGSACLNNLLGMQTLPPGMVTLDADGGAMRAKPAGGLLATLLGKVNDSAPFALNYVMPAEFLGYDTLTKKLASSAPGQTLQSVPLWKGVNDVVTGSYQINTPDRCDQSANECRTVSMFNQYVDGADWWGTPSVKWMTLWKTAWDGSIFDSASTSETVDFITNYFKQPAINGKRKRFPALFSVYLPGLDHDAHMNGMGHYKTFVQDTVDAKVSQIVSALKDKDEFDNKIFIIVSDHGHTAMPTDLTYIQNIPMLDAETGEPYEARFVRQAEMSCALKMEFAVNPGNEYLGKNAQEAEKNNNSLHILGVGRDV